MVIESECDGVYLAQVIVEQIAFGGGMCVSMPWTVLAGRRSCDWYNQQGEPVPITIG